jgi:hypothetical protein
MPAHEGWFVPLEYVLALVGAFWSILAFLFLGMGWRVYVNHERRLIIVESYTDPKNEAERNELLMTKFQVMLTAMELRISQNFTNTLDARRRSIEATITEQVGEVVKTIKNGGTT